MTCPARSPLVRKMARENNIDLSKVKGTGAGARITKQDLENYMAQGATSGAAPAPAPAPATAVSTAPAPPQQQPPRQAVATIPAPVTHEAPAQFRGEAPSGRVEPMSIMRQKIAEHMVFSAHTSVHVTTVHKVDMTRIAKVRDRLKSSGPLRLRIDVPAFVARAAAGPAAVPDLVPRLTEPTSLSRDISTCIACLEAIDRPVVRRRRERGFAPALHRRSRRARPLTPASAGGSQEALRSPTGSFGSVFATPVINQPQVAILGVGSVEKEPVVVDDAIAIRSMCYLALTFDHRLIDGALADQFTAKVKSVLENWSEEVL